MHSFIIWGNWSATWLIGLLSGVLGWLPLRLTSTAVGDVQIRHRDGQRAPQVQCPLPPRPYDRALLITSTSIWKSGMITRLMPSPKYRIRGVCQIGSRQKECNSNTLANSTATQHSTCLTCDRFYPALNIYRSLWIAEVLMKLFMCSCDRDVDSCWSINTRSYRHRDIGRQILIASATNATLSLDYDIQSQCWCW